MALVSNIIVRDCGLRDMVLDHWTAYAQQYPVSAINVLRQLLAAISFHIPDNKPEVPMLILRSTCDHLVDPRCSSVIAEHWDLPMRTHSSAGHDIPLDDGEWVCDRISEWLCSP